MDSYRDLEVWKLTMDLASQAIEVTRAFPSDERFGLASQLRRSAVSVPSNIAEGWGRGNTGDYIRFLRISNGSLKELETQILLSQRAGYMTDELATGMLAICDRAGRMLRGLIRSLEAQ